MNILYKLTPRICGKSFSRLFDFIESVESDKACAL